MAPRKNNLISIRQEVRDELDLEMSDVRDRQHSAHVLDDYRGKNARWLQRQKAVRSGLVWSYSEKARIPLASWLLTLSNTRIICSRAFELISVRITLPRTPFCPVLIHT